MLHEDIGPFLESHHGKHSSSPNQLSTFQNHVYERSRDLTRNFGDSRCQRRSSLRSLMDHINFVRKQLKSLFHQTKPPCSASQPSPRSFSPPMRVLSLSDLRRCSLVPWHRATLRETCFSARRRLITSSARLKIASMMDAESIDASPVLAVGTLTERHD